MHIEAVQTVVSPNPMTWRISVTGGITIAIMAIVLADAGPGGRSITASCAYSCWP